MILPDYQGNSIANLMRSIGDHYGVRTPYNPCPQIPPSFLEDGDTVVLIVIDGLGWDFLSRFGRHSQFWKHTQGKLTSVFPSTTAAAMTCYYSGLAPLNHGLPAWFTYLRSFGLISTILPMHIRGFQASLLSNGLSAGDVVDFSCFTSRLTCPSSSILPQSIYKTPFSDFALAGSQQVSFISDSPTDFFSKLQHSIVAATSQRFILGYWAGFDAVAHMSGIESEAALTHFNLLDRQFGAFLDHIQENQSDIKIIVSADHGLIDTTPEHTILMAEHPQLRNYLTLPLSGEARVPFFYVRPRYTSQFEAYMEGHFPDLGRLLTYEDYSTMPLFGLGDVHPEFWNRVGDYILPLNENYIFIEKLKGERPEVLIGNHGGWSRDEMYVPLILL